MLEIIYVGGTEINWNLYLSCLKTVLGRSVSRGLDDKRMPVSNLGAFVTTIAEMEEEGRDPVSVQREAGSLLSHGHLIFIVIASKELTFDLIKESRLNFTTGESKDPGIIISIVSGELSAWREAIINCSTDRMKYGVRLFANKCLLQFSELQLGHLFAKYAKFQLPDTTFKLIENR
jgi:hypothetical protein